MTHVYEGAPDARQSDDTELVTSRFRPKYRALSGPEVQLHDEIKSAAQIVEALFLRVDKVRAEAGHGPMPREGALALTKLEEAVMWSVKGLTA